MQNTVKLFFKICIMMLVQNAFAQQQYFFTNYTDENGLSNNEVRCIIKDSDGFLWVGTAAGLNRFNGYDFTVYKSLANDSTTIPSNIINGFFVDHNMQLWIPTFLGVCVYEKKKNQFRRILFHLSDGKQVYSKECAEVFEDSKKNIWITTIGSGLFKYNEKQDCFEEATPQLITQSKSPVNPVIRNSDGTFWYTTYTHLIHFNPADNSTEEFENRIPDEGNNTFQSTRVFADADNENVLWIATWGSGLVRFNKLSRQFVNYRFDEHVPSNIDNIVFQTHGHGKNKLWLATNSGVMVFDTEKQKFEGIIRDSLSEKQVINKQAQCIYMDDDGVTWIGTVAGLCNIHPAKQYFINNPLWKNPPVSRFYYDEEKEKIYGIRFYSHRSLYVYDRKLNAQTVYQIPDADKLMAEPFSVIEDTNGLIWIGTTKGIYTFDESKKKFELFDIEKDLKTPDRSVFIGYAFKDSRGNIWFSCYSKGIIKIDVNSKTTTPYFHNEKDKSSFPLYAVSRITEGNEKTIYACDESRGIIKMNVENNKWEHFNPDNDKYRSLATATDMAVDTEQRIWVCTRNNGLVCIDMNHVVTAYVKDDSGNIVDEQQSIVIDNSGKVWLTASNGMYRFDPVTKSFTHFTAQDGLPVKNITESLLKLNDGMITYFFNKGIFSFNPSAFSITDKALDVHLTSLLVNGKTSLYSNTINQLDTIRLTHTENNFTVEFAATNFTNPTSATYSYILEGSEKDWSVPARTRLVNFSNLAPGDYHLKIRTGSNSPEKIILIRIIPAWWQTSWFKWLLLFAAIFIFVFSIRFLLSFRYKKKIAQLEKQREIENIRMRISRDIHDEIGSGLTKIKLMSRNLAKLKEGAVVKETTAKISAASDELIQNLGEIVWTINPANDSLENVFAYARNYLSKLFDENLSIKLKLEFPEMAYVPAGVMVNPDVKRNLHLIIKEAITNVLKHAHATEVTVSLKADKSKIEMTIQDNGIGIDDNTEAGFGNGIKNIYKRAELIKAQIKVESNARIGTRIFLRVPI